MYKYLHLIKNDNEGLCVFVSTSPLYAIMYIILGGGMPKFGRFLIRKGASLGAPLSLGVLLV